MKLLEKRLEMAKKYTVILEPNYPEEGYTVRVPALLGALPMGEPGRKLWKEPKRP